MKFKEHKEITATDCEAVATLLTELAEEIREGNLSAFEEFWYAGGTEEGDARIFSIRDNLLLRYAYREENLNSGSL